MCCCDSEKKDKKRCDAILDVNRFPPKIKLSSRDHLIFLLWRCHLRITKNHGTLHSQLYLKQSLTPYIISMYFIFLLLIFEAWRIAFAFTVVPANIICSQNPRFLFLNTHASKLRTNLMRFQYSSNVEINIFPDIPRSSLTSAVERVEEEPVPATMQEAWKRFLLGPDNGPSMTIASILTLVGFRLSLHQSIIIDDVLIFGLAIGFWSIQEHILHDHLLHSKFDWIGKQIHQSHHDKPYFHISIDPPWLIMSWLSVVGFLVCVVGKLILPLPTGLSFVIGYALSGFWYEWTHYIVHTKVRTKNTFFRAVRDHHIKHHLVNDHYWFGFSFPVVDDWFGTNPDVKSLTSHSISCDDHMLREPTP